VQPSEGTKSLEHPAKLSDMTENKSLKAGWQINSATSLNIYSCWVEIIFCCKVLKKVFPPSYFSSENC